MKRFLNSTSMCVAVVICAMLTSRAFAQPQVAPGGAPMTPHRPRQPGGILGDSLGNYLTIEGILYQGKGKVESNTLIVDTVDGKKLDKPIGVLIRNVRQLPPKVRCVLKGYELGEMIGTPPAVPVAAKELGTTYDLSAAMWRWRPYFVVLIPVEPKGLELLK